MPADIALDVGGHRGFAIDQFLVRRWAERLTEYRGRRGVTCSRAHLVENTSLYKSWGQSPSSLLCDRAADLAIIDVT